MSHRARFAILAAFVAAALVLVSSRTPAQPAQSPGPPAIAADAVLAHTKVLASDEFEGRLPGTKGEDLSVKYIAGQFAKAGLTPAVSGGNWFQNVPLVGTTADPNTSLVFAKGGASRTLKYKDDVVAWTKRVQEKVSVANSDVVFVGYGVEAPEFQWDDFKGIDLTGKTMVVLIGDPAVPDAADPAKLDPKVFGGRTMTYYGRWTYKYEMGAAKKAAAVIIVHETEPAAYPFAVVQTKVTEQFDLLSPDKGMGRAAIEGWITIDQAKALFAMAGQDFDTLKKRAATRAFTPVPLGVTASMTLNNTIRTIDSRNVAGVIEGSDPKLKDEFVVFTSHWDAYGIGPEINGDRIYNGALDNATGVAGLIELARAFAALPVKPKRSLLFLAVTAEEQGLLGSEHYAQNPLFPLAKTVAVVNMDGLNIYGKTKDLTVVGLGQSDLDDYARAAAAGQGRDVRADPTPEKGSYFRSDHFPFAKQGVPAINAGGGDEYAGRPADYGQKMQDAYTAQHYHKPSDEVRPDWNLEGAVQDLQVYFAIGYRAAQSDAWPAWKPGSEFKARRDRMLRK
jgi:Zn-dependent M28 family amino/carboxypeptidase